MSVSSDEPSQSLYCMVLNRRLDLQTEQLVRSCC